MKGFYLIHLTPMYFTWNAFKESYHAPTFVTFPEIPLIRLEHHTEKCRLNFFCFISTVVHIPNWLYSDGSRSFCNLHIYAICSMGTLHSYSKWSGFYVETACFSIGTPL